LVSDDDTDEVTLEDRISEGEEFIELEATVIHDEGGQEALDYQNLFNYLTGSVKHYDFSVGSYMSYDTPDCEEASDDFFNPEMNDELIDEILRAKKTMDMYGVEVYVNPMKKSLFDVWKLGNTVELRMRYDMIAL
jgi:hypothetical protein